MYAALGLGLKVRVGVHYRTSISNERLSTAGAGAAEGRATPGSNTAGPRKSGPSERKTKSRLLPLVLFFDQLEQQQRPTRNPVFIIEIKALGSGIGVVCVDQAIPVNALRYLGQREIHHIMVRVDDDQ